jgi:hypothetical protein
MGVMDAVSENPAIDIPLARCADQTLRRLASLTGSPAIGKLEGATLLGERGMLGGMTIPVRTSAGGGCRLFDAPDDTIALNLSRPSDRELLPALFETHSVDTGSEESIAALIWRSEAAMLVSRGRALGLAIASENESLRRAGSAGAERRAAAGSSSLESVRVELVPGLTAIARDPRPPRVVDLSALWAGPLAAHLLWLAGADVVKVESRARPDAMRTGDTPFYALLNQGKSSVALDFKDPDDQQVLLSLIAGADIVIEAARPRALLQLGIDADRIVRTTPGLTWISITAHGSIGEASNWVGFGDDCGVAGGLSAALRAATGRTGFVGDAIADPLAGMSAALAAWEAWMSRRGGRFGVGMSQVAAQCLTAAREDDPVALQSSLISWAAAAGKPFPTVARRSIGAVASFGEDTRAQAFRLQAM